uniref:Uncharacterized protein n=1 Tax=Panagrolaimus sp. PS1159 TaxID=55785 RepID=A0AC35GXG4_9BILA
MGNIVGYLTSGGYFYPLLVQQSHERLIAAIKDQKSQDVLEFINHPAWQDIFRRQKNDIKSPMQLLLLHMPKEAAHLQQKCIKEGCSKYLLELLNDSEVIDYMLLTQQNHERLIAAIKEKQSKEVLDFMDLPEWQDIFRRQKSDTQSPMQLLLIHMPKIAERLQQKCKKEGCIKYLTELLNDYS